MEKLHEVWIKIPTMDPEVYGRYATRRDAERIAPALQRRAERGRWMVDFGACEVWIRSPGTIEDALHRMHDAYEEG